jgi:hypothetical protein
MANDTLHEVRRMVQRAIEAGHPYLDEDRCALLLEATDDGDLSAIHDLLVEGMIELRGVDFTRRLLQDVDGRHETDMALHRLH